MKHKQSAFNLIEVALSLAIVGFAMIGILGLFSVGLETSNQAINENTVSMLVTSIVADRESAAFDEDTPAISQTSFAIPSMSSTRWPYYLYFPKSGGTPVAGIDTAGTWTTNNAYYYEVEMALVTNVNASGLAKMDIKASWPAYVAATNRQSVLYFSTSFCRH